MGSSQASPVTNIWRLAQGTQGRPGPAGSQPSLSTDALEAQEAGLALCSLHDAPGPWTGQGPQEMLNGGSGQEWGSLEFPFLPVVGHTVFP